MLHNLFGKKKASAKSKTHPPENPSAEKPSAENKDGSQGEGGGGGKPPTIERGDCFYHKESKKLYQVQDFEYGALANGTIVPIICYSGKDLKLFKQNVFLFLQNFTKIATPKFKRSDMEKMEKQLHKALAARKALPAGLEAGKEVSADEIPISDSDTTVDGESVPLGTLYTPTERHDINNMIVWPDAKEALEVAIDSITKQKELNEHWELQKLDEDAKKSILNFYGPSGTGKTMVARCTARIAGKKLFQVNYSEIVDKYVGETGKHISQAFATAKEKGAILFFDEADSLCSKRVDMTVNVDYANSVNQNRNILMQELDKFDEIIIMATNFFNNFDEALLRRINAHIEFKLPNKEMRVKLFKLHIPNLDLAKEVDFEKLATESLEFSGGDIRNVCINGMKASSRDSDRSKWLLTQDALLKEIQRIKDSKESHKKTGSNTRRKEAIGFGAKPLTDID